MLMLLNAGTSMDDDAVETHWNSALWYLVGVALYLALLAIEWALRRDWPERLALRRTELALVAYARAVEAAENPARPLAALPYSPTTADPVTTARRRIFDTIALARTVLGSSRWRRRGLALLAQAEDTTAHVTAVRFLGRCGTGSGGTGSGGGTGLLGTGERPGPLVQIAEGAADRARTLTRSMLPAPTQPGAPTKPDTLPLAATAPAAQSQRPLWHRLRHPGHDALMQGVRLAACLAAAGWVHVLLGTPHSYWVVVAVALIMKPDVGSVYARALQRSLGVIGGVGVGWLIFELVPKGWWHVVVIALLTALMPWAKGRGYIWQAVIFTPVVLVFTNLVLPGTAPDDYGPERLEATALGAAIVVVLGFAIWPRSRHHRIGTLATAARTRLAALAQQEGDDAAATHAARVASEQATRALRDQLARGLSEPASIAVQAAAWTPSAAVLERLVELTTAVQRLPRSAERDEALTGLARLVTPSGAEAPESSAASEPAPVPAPGAASAEGWLRPTASVTPRPEDPARSVLRALGVLGSMLETIEPAAGGPGGPGRPGVPAR